MKKRLLDRAIRVFSEKGYAATNLTDITDSLGTTRSPVYYYFKDKKGLFTATYNFWEKEYGMGIDRILSQEKPIIKILEDTTYYCLELNKIFNRNYFLSIETSPDLAELCSRYYKLIENIYNRKIESVTQAMERNEIRQDINPKILVDMVYVIFDGIRLGLERPAASIQESEVKELIALELLNLDRYCNDPTLTKV